MMKKKFLALFFILIIHVLEMRTIHIIVYRRGDGLGKLQRRSDSLDRQMERVYGAKERAMKSFDLQYKKLTDKKFKVDCRISGMQNLREKNCKHSKDKYGRTKHRNMRDDSSFEWYVNCGNCGAVLWDECYGPGGGYP